MNAFDHSRCWPVAYHEQRNADLPDGPLIDEEPVDSPRVMFFVGILVGLLVIGPALCDLWSVI